MIDIGCQWQDFLGTSLKNRKSKKYGRQNDIIDLQIGETDPNKGRLTSNRTNKDMKKINR